MKQERRPQGRPLTRALRAALPFSLGGLLAVQGRADLHLAVQAAVVACAGVAVVKLQRLTVVEEAIPADVTAVKLVICCE